MPKKRKKYQKKTFLQVLERKGLNVVVPLHEKQNIGNCVIDPSVNWCLPETLLRDHSPTENISQVLKKHNLTVVPSTSHLVSRIRKRNRKLPIFVFTDRMNVHKIPLKVHVGTCSFLFM